MKLQYGIILSLSALLACGLEARLEKDTRKVTIKIGDKLAKEGPVSVDKVEYAVTEKYGFPGTLEGSNIVWKEVAFSQEDTDFVVDIPKKADRISVHLIKPYRVTVAGKLKEEVNVCLVDERSAPWGGTMPDILCRKPGDQSRPIYWH